MILNIVPSGKTVCVLATAVLTPVLSDIVSQILAFQPVLKLVSQGVLWLLSVAFVLLGVLNRWKEFKKNDADKGTS